MDDRPILSRFRRAFVRPGTGTILGASLIVIALTTHTSDSEHVVGRWSGLYTAILATSLLIVLSLALLVFRSARGTGGNQGDRPSTKAPNKVRLPVRLLDQAFLLYGATYLAGAFLEPATAARAVDLNFFGSTIPILVILEWVVLGCFVVSGLTMVPRLPAWAINPALLFGALIVSILGLEGVARAAAIIRPEIQGFPTNRAQMWHRRYVELNAGGFRDREHSTEVPPLVDRLLVVGDSYAFGSGVDQPDERFGQHLADGLYRATGTPWEVVFAALPDTDTQQHFEFLEYGLRYHPRLVILLYVFNDIDYLAPPFRVALTQHPNSIAARLNPVRILMTNSFAFQELYARGRHLGRFTEEPFEAIDPYTDPTLLSHHIEDLRRFVAAAEAKGVNPVILPFDVAVTASEDARNRHERFVTSARSSGLPVWSLTDSAFRGFDFDALTVNRLDRHPNATANMLLADAALPLALELLDSVEQ